MQARAGLANREIAAQLMVTIRTVEFHLSHAYGKLDIGSRGDLPAALRLGGAVGAAGDQPDPTAA